MSPLFARGLETANGPGHETGGVFPFQNSSSQRVSKSLDSVQTLLQGFFFRRAAIIPQHLCWFTKSQAITFTVNINLSSTEDLSGKLYLFNKILRVIKVVIGTISTYLNVYRVFLEIHFCITVAFRRTVAQAQHLLFKIIVR